MRVAEPFHRPESLRARLETAWSVLGSLAEARDLLSAQAASLEARAQVAPTERERVSATIGTYRVEAALDDVLTIAQSRVSALMKERGLR